MKFYCDVMDEEFKVMHPPISKCAFCGKVIKQGEEFWAWSGTGGETDRITHIIHKSHLKEGEIEKLIARKASEKL
jgi:hypothetical protein